MPECGLLFKKKGTETEKEGTFKIELYISDNSQYRWLTPSKSTLEIDGYVFQEREVGPKKYELTINDVDDTKSGEYTVSCEDGNVTNSIYVGKYNILLRKNCIIDAIQWELSFVSIRL